MLFFKVVNGDVVAVEDKAPMYERDLWAGRHEMKEMADAERIAKSATQLNDMLYTAIDNGPNVWPRYDVIEAPKVGDPVSYAFNGDYYPDGEITHITPGTLRQIKTSTGSKYYRRQRGGRQSGSWVKKGGTWSLVQGHCDDKNPHF